MKIVSQNSTSYRINEGNFIRLSVPLILRIFSINFSPMIPGLRAPRGLSIRRIFPEARMTAIKSSPSDSPRVDFLTPEYFLHLRKENINVCLM